MNPNDTKIRTSTLRISSDRTQHCVVSKEPQGRYTAMDACPMIGGKGEEFSPADLVGAGLAGCIFFAMGTLARRDGLDLTGTKADVGVTLAKKRIDRIDLRFRMPRGLSTEQRAKLERASAACPIKPSFHPDIPIRVRFEYPECDVTRDDTAAAPETSLRDPKSNCRPCRTLVRSASRDRQRS